MKSLHNRCIAALASAMLFLACSSNDDAAPPEARAALDRGFRALIQGLEDARDAVENPWVVGPLPSDRELADGYRYMLGHLIRLAESEFIQHTDLPYFQRYIRMASKSTIDNPDTLYLMAPIDPSATYQISARAADTDDWRTGQRTRRYPKAPRLVTFQTVTATIGDTGDLDEFTNCRNQTLSFVQHFEIHPDSDGRFDILVAEDRPAGYDGHFLTTRGKLECSPPRGEPFEHERSAAYIAVRESFSNWDAEVPLELEIVRIDAPGKPRPALDAKATAERLESIGTKVANQVRFWNALHEFGLEIHGDRNLDGKRNLPENAMNDPAPPFIAGGTAGARQLYASGTFNIAPDEALVVRVETRLEPYYIGFQLANFWGESLDQASYTSSLTGSQLSAQPDGARYYVVAMGDPGVPGWLDTTGLAKGAMAMRFVYREDPDDTDLPQIRTTLTKLDAVREHLPGATAEITPEMRRTEIARRQAHIRKRWRQY